MLCGDPPFYAESLVETYNKIQQHETSLQLEFPEDSGIALSGDAKHLLRNLLCKRDQRLGQHGVEDFRQHPFFDRIDWENIRSGWSHQMG